MSEGESDREQGLALEKEAVADLLGQLLSTITVWDRVRAAPIVEDDDDYELAVSDDGELLVRITPPEEYDAAISADHINDFEGSDTTESDGSSAWAELSVSREGIGVSLYEAGDAGEPVLLDEWWRTHSELQSGRGTNQTFVIGARDRASSSREEGTQA